MKLANYAALLLALVFTSFAAWCLAPIWNGTGNGLDLAGFISASLFALVLLSASYPRGPRHHG
jgi:hypothetical protein